MIWAPTHLWLSTNKDVWYKTAQLSKISIWSIWSHTTLKRRGKFENFKLHGKYFPPQRNKPMPRKSSCRRVVKEVKWKAVEDHRGLLQCESAQQLRRNRRVIPVDETEGRKRHEETSGRLVGRARCVQLTKARQKTFRSIKILFVRKWLLVASRSRWHESSGRRKRRISLSVNRNRRIFKAGMGEKLDKEKR